MEGSGSAEEGQATGGKEQQGERSKRQQEVEQKRRRSGLFAAFFINIKDADVFKLV